MSKNKVPDASTNLVIDLTSPSKSNTFENFESTKSEVTPEKSETSFDIMMEATQKNSKTPDSSNEFKIKYQIKKRKFKFLRK